METWYTYILYSEKIDRYYVGYTWNIKLRLDRHNKGMSRSTKAGRPWKIVYVELYNTKSEAIKREYQIKRWKSRKMIEELVQS